MNGQFPSLVVRQSEASLNVFQRADILRASPAGVHALAEHQLVPDVSAGLTSGGGRESGYCSVAVGARAQTRAHAHTHNSAVSLSI